MEQHQNGLADLLRELPANPMHVVALSGWNWTACVQHKHIAGL